MYADRTQTASPICTLGRIDLSEARRHNVRMKKVGHFLREWREQSGLTLAQVAERFEHTSERRTLNDPNVRPLTMTHATLSRIERGKHQYNQGVLEVLAEIYRTDVASLIMRDPSAPEGIWGIWDQLAPVQREQVVEIAKTIKRTGTEG